MPSQHATAAPAAPHALPECDGLAAGAPEGQSFARLQAIAYFESGGVSEPGVRLLIFGDSLAGGFTHFSPGPPDAPWAAQLQQHLGVRPDAFVPNEPP